MWLGVGLRRGGIKDRGNNSIKVFHREQKTLICKFWGEWRLNVCVCLQIARIQELENEFPVKIEVQKNLSRIHIHGLPDHNADVLPHIYSIFREVEEAKREKIESDYIAKEVTNHVHFLYQ